VADLTPVFLILLARANAGMRSWNGAIGIIGVSCRLSASRAIAQNAGLTIPFVGLRCR
jgi:hypothetical protein